MKYGMIAGALLAPSIAMAASGAGGSGFGPEDWIAKWPVLVTVICVVAGTTTFLTLRVRARARTVRSK